MRLTCTSAYLLVFAELIDEMRARCETLPRFPTVFCAGVALPFHQKLFSIVLKALGQDALHRKQLLLHRRLYVNRKPRKYQYCFTVLMRFWPPTRGTVNYSTTSHEKMNKKRSQRYMARKSSLCAFQRYSFEILIQLLPKSRAKNTISSHGRILSLIGPRNDVILSQNGAEMRGRWWEGDG